MNHLKLPSIARVLLACLAPLALAAGCGDDSSAGGSGGSGGAGGGGGNAGGSGGESGTVPQLEEGWTEFQPGGDTLCSHGDPYSFWVRKGTTNKLVIDFIGGGACWDEGTCRLSGAVYTPDVEDVRGRIESGDQSGIYDDKNPDNPIGEYYHVIVPYCTGDIHWGNNDATYGTGKDAYTIHHRGAVNARAVLDWVYESFSNPEEIFVTGCSAGSYGAAMWSAHVMDHYPESKIVQLGDSGAGIVTDTFFQESFPSWKAEGAFPAWIPELDPEKVDIQALALNDLYSHVANTYPKQRMSQYNTVRDEDQLFYYNAMGGDEADWLPLMQASISDIESRTDNFAAFIAPGEQHCIVPYDNFYTVNSDGQKLVDWVQSALDGEAVESVKCQGAECDKDTPQ